MKILKIKNYDVLLDDEDFKKVSEVKWWPSKRKNGAIYFQKAYKSATEPRGEYLHRFLVEAPKGKVVDHANHNTLDNRKCNLRICTPSENSYNRGKTKINASGFKGVYEEKDGRKKKWRAEITYNKKTIYLGNYYSKIEAAQAVNNGIKRYHKDFGYLNTVDDIV